MTVATANDGDSEIGEVQGIEDFLPPPERLVLKP